MATRIPINKDNFGFENKQDDIWTRMEQDMERRRREWESEIDTMSKDFFQLRTDKDRTFGPLSDKMSLPNSSTDGKSTIEKDEHGHPVFKASFNVQEYKPEEVNVKMDSNKIIVQAKHEEKAGGKSVSREYSRELNIPSEIDPMALQCKLRDDGILVVEAPFPVPDYEKTGSPHFSKINISHTPNISSPPFQAPSGLGTPPVSQAREAQTFSQPQHSAPPYQHSVPTHQAQAASFRNSPPSHHITTATHFQSAPSTSSTYHPGPGGSSVFSPTKSGSPKTASPRTESPINVKDKMFKLDIDIEDYSPEELTVKTQDNKISISARRESKIGNRTSTQELSREFHIPDTVDPLTIKAFFTDGGKLVVEAPYKQGASGPNTNGGGYPGATMTGR